MTLFKWWFGDSLKIYPALPMTGKTGKQVWAKYRKQRRSAAKYKISIHSPVPGEGIKDNDKFLTDRKGKGATTIWQKDKSQIDSVNGILFDKPCMHSQGSIFELAKARGSRWMITAFVHPKPGFIAREQADITAKGLDSAFKQLSERFGSRHKRFWWRLGIWNKSVLKAIILQLKELFL